MRELTEEQKRIREEKKARRAERRENVRESIEDVKDKVAENFVPVLLGIVLPVGAFVGLCTAIVVASTKSENAYNDRLAHGYGFTDRNDPGYVRLKYENQREENLLYLKAKGDKEARSSDLDVYMHDDSTKNDE